VEILFHFLAHKSVYYKELASLENRVIVDNINRTITAIVGK